MSEKGADVAQRNSDRLAAMAAARAEEHPADTAALEGVIGDRLEALAELHKEEGSE